MEYFSHRHVWVLLPGLPLNLWNISALTAIDNLLGRFLKVDEAGLKGTDKRMVKVIVEIDVTAGLMDSLEVEWRGQVMVQRLDYLGIPFRCSLCRRTGHLRRDCSFGDNDGDVEDSQDDSKMDAYMSEEETGAQGALYAGSEVGLLEDDLASLIGKLRIFCPNLFIKLSAWDRDFLEKSSLSNAVKEGLSSKAMEPEFLGGSTYETVGDTTVPQAPSSANLSPKVSQPMLVLDNPYLPRQSSAFTPNLDDVIDALLLSLRDSDNPIPIPIYQERDLLQILPSSVPACSSSGKGEQKGKSLAWSRGLGYELSPIKTRSVRKKASQSTVVQ